MIKNRSSDPIASGLLLTLLALMGLGLTQVYSSSFILAIESYGDGLYFFKRQVAFTILGFVVMFVTAKAPTSFFSKYGSLFWMGSLAALVLTLVPGLGLKIGGAQRWIRMPLGVHLEPSEFLKVGFCLFWAGLMSKSDRILEKIPWWAVTGLCVASFGILLSQPDFGSFALVTLVSFGLLFAFGLRWRFIIATLAIATPAFYFMVMMVPYRKARVLAFLDPWADPERKGFQVIQSMLSFQSGGIFGTGLGHGQGKLYFLPEAHTDFALAVLGEELGFIGFVALLVIYGIVVFKAFQMALNHPEKHSRILALGLGLTFAFSIFINVGVVLGLLPTKGMTLPFLSYGGSSLLALSFLGGLLLNLERSMSGWARQSKIVRR